MGCGDSPVDEATFQRLQQLRGKDCQPLPISWSSGLESRLTRQRPAPYPQFDSAVSLLAPAVFQLLGRSYPLKPLTQAISLFLTTAEGPWMAEAQ